MTPYAKRLAPMSRTADALKYTFDNMTDPNVINFGGGTPAKEAIPVETMRQLAQEILSDKALGTLALQYAHPVGYKPLRETVVRELLEPKGLYGQTFENVMIVSGGLETMNLVCELFIDPGDVILVENPAFYHCVGIFQMFQARLIPCETDEKGLVMEDVEAKIREYKPKMVYTVPTFNNPTGNTMPADRRKKLAELGSAYDVIILEDDPYRDIRYSGEELAPIKSYDKTGNTIMAGSFSKIFAPGTRLGYCVASPEIIQQLVGIKLLTNSQTTTLSQVLCNEFFRRGLYPEHHKHLCDLYRERRDIMLKAVDKYFPEGTKRSDPDGGFYTWIELPGGLNATKLRPRATEMGIAYLAGESWFVRGGGEGSNTLRLCFASTAPDKIEPAVKALGAMFCRAMEEQ